MLRRTRTCAEALSIVLALLFIGGVAHAAAPPPSTTLVKATEAWTSTGVTLREGERVAIAATGRVYFGRAPIDAMDPGGVPWGSRCTRVTERQQRLAPWPAPGIACWSLIARIGGSAPLVVGRSAIITAPKAGTLELGVNDNYLRDNRSAWAVTVRPLASTGSQSSSNLAAILLVAAVAAGLLALVILFVVLARRRNRRPALAAPVRASAGEASAVGPENDDVNIFEVEFVEAGLRVGYSYFPEGTVVRWQIGHGGDAQREGEFVADGGTEPHYVVLGIADTTDISRVAIRFEWSIGSVPFEYAITRDRALRE